MDRIAEDERSSGGGVSEGWRGACFIWGVLADRLVFKSAEKPHVTYADTMCQIT